ncbi:MAG TPA: substrate-binding domain-containing protein [Burkholderiaceae bacterium]|nr:substrate-binding domain-containing protein [Burkholderiaceae bacterium]
MNRLLPLFRTALFVAACAAVLAARPAAAAEIRVLSAGAVEPGLRPALRAFEQTTGHRVALQFATAPQIAQRTDAADAFDIVIAPALGLDGLQAASALRSERARRVPIGSVGIGVAVRPGAPVPDLSSTESFTRALLEADSLAYNRASTGLWFEGVLQRLGLTERLAAKTQRFDDGAAVMRHVLNGRGREIGVGATTEILLLREQGLQLVGPLPASMQNRTTYIAAPTAASPPPEVDALMQHLDAAATRAGFVAAGIEPAR